VAGIRQAAIAVWSPFEKEFGLFNSELQDRNEDVNEEIRLASAQAAFQDQQLQVVDREQGALFRHKIGKRSKEAHEWRLQADERHSSKIVSLEQAKLY
jgi:hypothetical protein